MAEEIELFDAEGHVGQDLRHFHETCWDTNVDTSAEDTTRHKFPTSLLRPPPSAFYPSHPKGTLAEEGGRRCM